MPGYTKDENSLATGIPDRTIGPETGSFGNATMTNKGDTSEGTNQDHESRPAPAAGIGGSSVTTDDLGEHRTFEEGASAVEFPESDIEPVYQQIADGGDHFDHHKHLHEDEEREEEEDLSEEDRSDRPLP
jgi:hypothetical protein